MFAEAGVDVAIPVAEPVAIEPAALPIEATKEYTLKSGVTVVIDKLEVGGKVDIKGEDGSLSPAPAGEHEMADGMIIVLDETSAIVEIKDPAMEAEPAVEVEINAPSAEAELMKKKIEEMQQQLDSMKSKQSMSEASVAKFSKAVEELSGIVIALINTPSAEPMEAPKDKFSKHTESYSEKVSKFLDLAKSIKK